MVEVEETPQLQLYANRRKIVIVGKSTELEELFQNFLQNLDRKYIEKNMVDPDSTDETIVFETFIDGAFYRLSRLLPVPSKCEINLSPREREIVRLVAGGMTNKTIATVLDVSPWTVATHLRRVFIKLEVKSRAEMIAQVLVNGLLDHQE